MNAAILDGGRRAAARVLAASAAGIDRLPASPPWWREEIRCLAAMHRFHGRSRRAVRHLPAVVGVDRRGVPHVAGDGEELWHAFGFVTAAARYFQMDLIRRKAAGRAAELLGADMADRDAAQRTLGLEFYAERIATALPADQRAMLEAYARGVNALLSHATPWEYAALGRPPEPWRPMDSVLVVQDMFQQLTDPWVSDLERPFARAGGGALPHGGGTGLDGTFHEDPEALERLRVALRSAGRAGGRAAPSAAAGSNGWALSADRTIAGPLLANDIHLPLGTPGPLFFIRVTAGGRPAHGFAIPGVPAIVAGANPDLAWGLTRLCGRTAERLAAGAPGTGIVVDGEQEIRGAAQRRTVRVRLAEAGPVLDDGTVLRWTALAVGGVDFGLAHLLRCRSVREACEVATAAGAPPTSLLAADRRGRIAWTVAGRLLRAPRSKDRGPARFVPVEQVPRIVDPRSGLLVTANQELRVPLADGTPVTVNAYPDARARRIVEMLRERARWDARALMDVQYDVDASFYRPWAALFTAHAERWPRTQEALRAWDGTAGVRARGLHHLVVMHGLARQEMLAALTPRTPRPARDALAPPALGGLDAELADLAERRDPVALPPRFGDWPEFLSWCVEAASRYLDGVLGARAAELTWGEVNRLRLPHPLAARLPRLARLIEPPHRRMAGCLQSVRASATGFGAAMRMVAAPRTGELWVNWPGQSCDPLAAGDRSLLRAWNGGRAVRMRLGRRAAPGSGSGSGEE